MFRHTVMNKNFINIWNCLLPVKEGFYKITIRRGPKPRGIRNNYYLRVNYAVLYRPFQEENVALIRYSILLVKI